VGGSHLLPRLGGSFGMYLALTGERIRYGDALGSGLASHTMKAGRLADLIGRLTGTGDADLALRELSSPAPRETDAATLEAIALHFGRPSLRAIIDSLESAGPDDPFAARTLATMRSRSPTSLCVAFREIGLGATMPMRECMRLEFRILNRMLQGHDFYEGIRARIVDKDNAPRWDPPTLEAVDPGDIDRYFAPLGEGELDL
jgi:enoyl-CoA hydratase/carnithine racemase